MDETQAGHGISAVKSPVVAPTTMTSREPEIVLAGDGVWFFDESSGRLRVKMKRSEG